MAAGRHLGAEALAPEATVVCGKRGSSCDFALPSDE